eukprot:TRINITY_DN48295_c0_g1_i1.p1 TRINITY_DN48295_c0_g1~~TRINITY_DN48295_c0_g1_i1.p1  ORF type:complete len:295 (+),score=55.57 TRINITY_DN48295_c0_g1_i1:78-962(+)
MPSVEETRKFREALETGNATSVQELLQNASPEHAAELCCAPLDDRGWTSLHCALEGPKESHLRLVRFLCNQRADVTASGHDAVTPLHLGAQHGSKYVVRMLLNARADNLKRTADGRSTVDFAKTNAFPTEIFEEVGWPDKGPNVEVLLPASRRAPAREWEENKAKAAANIQAAKEAKNDAAGNQSAGVLPAACPNAAMDANERNTLLSEVSDVFTSNAQAAREATENVTRLVANTEAQRKTKPSAKCSDAAGVAPSNGKAALEANENEPTDFGSAMGPVGSTAAKTANGSSKCA